MSKELASRSGLDRTKARTVAKLAIFLIGVATIHMFFFNFVALTIGLLFFLLSSGLEWKRHGLVLAIAAGVSTVIAHTWLGMSPLKLAFIYGTVPFVIYLLISIVWTAKPSIREPFSEVIIRIDKLGKAMPRLIRVLLIAMLTISPIVLWSSVSINLGVMLDNETRLLWIHAPTLVNRGDEFDLMVQAWDPYERLSATYTGSVLFSIVSYNLTTYSPIESPVATLPTPYTFTGQAFGSDIAYEIQDSRDNGRHVFSARVETPGIHYVLVEDSLTQNKYYSNPIIVKDLTPIDPRIYWGDFHAHSELSDGSGSPEHSYFYARHIAGLEFSALTEHSEIMMWAPGSFDRLEATTNAVNDPGSFIAFQGLEWTQVETGHYTCIFSGDQLIKEPILSYLHLPTTDSLWNALDHFTDTTGSRALALPHHTTQNAYVQDWTYINPKYVKIAEVTSVHGEFLYEQRHPLNYVGAIDPPPFYLNGSSIVDAFKMGYRMTLYASGDNHDGHPGHSLSHTPAFVGHQRPWSIWHTRNEHPYPAGITAVYTSGLTREDVFLGLERQKVFACSDHGRPFLDFTINGTAVGDGSVLQVSDSSATREIRIIIAQDGAPPGTRAKAASVEVNWEPDWRAEVEIIKNGEILSTVSIDSPVSEILFLDMDPLSGAVYGRESCVQRDGQYYINEYSNNAIDPDTLNTGGADFYIVRVVGRNGRYTYAGPIWVQVL